MYLLRCMAIWSLLVIPTATGLFHRAGKTPPRGMAKLLVAADGAAPTHGEELKTVEELKWWVKTEQFSKPFPVVKPHLEAHRAWVAELRTLAATDEGDATAGGLEGGPAATSGYRLGPDGKPGGGGLMLFRARDREAALALVLKDPLVANDCVDWSLNEWVAEVGGLAIL